MENALALGVDIGTTSIAAQIVSLESGDAVYTCGFDHGAAMDIAGYPDAYAADAEKLVSAALGLVRDAVSEYPGIGAVGFSGQMHGIICLGEGLRMLSPLYTWQNAFGERADGGVRICDGFRELTGEDVPTGYGFVTLYALGRLGLLPENTRHFATVADAAAARLCGLDRAVMHPTMAASLGLYDIASARFRAAAADIAGDAALPDICRDYEIIGGFSYGGREIPVAAACGDNQLGAFGALADDGMVLINIGTSSQVSIVGAEGCGESRPYFDGKRIMSGSGLCGGRAYAALAGLAAETAAAFGARPEKRGIYEYLNRLAEEPETEPLEISTRFCGTRDDPSLRGAIGGISLSNFDMRHLAKGVLRGIAEELHSMFLGMERPSGELRMAGAGNALRRCPALRRICAEMFGGELLMPRHTEEAAYGAALYAAVSAGLITREDSRTLIKYL